MTDGVQIPDFLPETYFLQPLSAYGVFVDRFGAIRRQFEVDITGTATDDGFMLDEAFLYDDGERETRQWVVTKTGDGSYQGRCDDVIGHAEGHHADNMLRWRYRFRLAMFGRKVSVHFDDVMVVHQDGRKLRSTSPSFTPHFETMARFTITPP